MADVPKYMQLRLAHTRFIIASKHVPASERPDHVRVVAVWIIRDGNMGGTYYRLIAWGDNDQTYFRVVKELPFEALAAGQRVSMDGHAFVVSDQSSDGVCLLLRRDDEGPAE